MATTLKNLADGVLASGALTTAYTVPTGTQTIIKTLVLTNTTGAVIAATVVINPASGGTDRTLISARNIAAGGTDLCPEIVNQVIGAGGLLRVQGNGLTYMASGAELVQ